MHFIFRGDLRSEEIKIPLSPPFCLTRACEHGGGDRGGGGNEVAEHEKRRGKEEKAATSSLSSLSLFFSAPAVAASLALF